MVLFNKKSFLVLIKFTFILFFITSLSACNIPVNSVQMSADQNFVYVGETLSIEGSVLPLDASDQRLNWSSSNQNIANVINGIVSGISPGTTVITASAPNGVSKSVEISVRVKNIEVTSVSVNNDQVSLIEGQSFDLSSSVSPSNATDKTISYTSSDTRVATVNSNGRINALNPGTTVITVRTSNGLTVTSTVTVRSQVVEVSSISLNRTQIGLEIGEAFNLVSTVSPNNATNRTVTYTSNNNSVATVNSSGRILAVNEGTATITARSSNGRTSTIRVFVRFGVGDLLFNEREPNGSMTLADFLPRNGTTFRGNNSSKSDVDVFRINVPSNVTISIIFSPEYDLDLPHYLIGLYNSADVLLATARRSGETLILTHQVTLAGNYYIWILYSNTSPYSSGDSYIGYVDWE